MAVRAREKKVGRRKAPETTPAPQYSLQHYCNTLGLERAEVALALSEVQAFLRSGTTAELPQRGSQSNVQLVNLWWNNDRGLSKVSLTELAMAIFRAAAKKQSVDPQSATLVTGDVSGQALIDIVSNFMGQPDNDRIWKNRVCASASDKTPLRVGYVTVPPFASDQAGQRFALDIAERVVRWLRVQPQPRQYSDFDLMVAALRKGEIDVIAPILLQSGHYVVEGIAFSEPLGLSMQHVVAVDDSYGAAWEQSGAARERRASHSPPRLSVADFQELEIIRLVGGTSEMLFDQLPLGTRFTEPVADKESALNLLRERGADGRLRGLIVSTGTLDEWRRIGRSPMRDFQLPLGIDLPLNFVFGFDSREEKLRDAVNMVLRQMKDFGVLHGLILQHSKDISSLVIAAHEIREAVTVKDWEKAERKHEERRGTSINDHATGPVDRQPPRKQIKSR